MNRDIGPNNKPNTNSTDSQIGLRDALSQINEIRNQVAKGQICRGFRSATVACSGIMTFIAASWQSLYLPNPSLDIPQFLFLWIGIALFSAGIAIAEMMVHSMRADASLTSQVNWIVWQQLSPSLIVGAILTFIWPIIAAEQMWMLPGIWAMIFSLGITSVGKMLPRSIQFSALYYMLSGAIVLILSSMGLSASMSMVLTFGIGQLITAGILYWTLERENGN